MATEVDFIGTNKCFTAPAGRDDVSDLHVFANGTCIVSCWELSEAELAEIIKTKRIYLSCMSGDTLFPVFVGGEKDMRDVVSGYGKTIPQQSVPDEPK